jgi:hypothetical protein
MLQPTFAALRPIAKSPLFQLDQIRVVDTYDFDFEEMLHKNLTICFLPLARPK